MYEPVCYIMLYLPWTIYSRDFYLNWTLSWGPHPAVNHVFFVPGGNQDLNNEIILLRCPMYGQWVQSFQTDKSNGIGSWCSPKTKPSCHRNLGSFPERAKLHAWTCPHREIVVWDNFPLFQTHSYQSHDSLAKSHDINPDFWWLNTPKLAS